MPGSQGCIRREGTSEAAAEAVGQAVGGGCQSGWGRLLSVTNAIEAGTWRQGDSGWASAGRPGGGGGSPPPTSRESLLDPSQEQFPTPQTPCGYLRHCQAVPAPARVDGLCFPFPLQQPSPLQRRVMGCRMRPSHGALHRLTGHGHATSEQIRRGAASEPPALSAQDAPCHATHQGSTGGR